MNKINLDKNKHERATNIVALCQTKLSSLWHKDTIAVHPTRTKHTTSTSGQCNKLAKNQSKFVGNDLDR